MGCGGSKKDIAKEPLQVGINPKDHEKNANAAEPSALPPTEKKKTEENHSKNDDKTAKHDHDPHPKPKEEHKSTDNHEKPDYDINPKPKEEHKPTQNHKKLDHDSHPELKEEHKPAENYEKPYHDSYPKPKEEHKSTESQLDHDSHPKSKEEHKSTGNHEKPDYDINPKPKEEHKPHENPDNESHPKPKEDHKVVEKPDHDSHPKPKEDHQAVEKPDHDSHPKPKEDHKTAEKPDHDSHTKPKEDHETAEKPDHDSQTKLKEEHKVTEKPDHNSPKLKEDHKASENPEHDSKHKEESNAKNQSKLKSDHFEENNDSKPAQAGGHAGSLISRGDKLLKKAGPKEKAFYKYLFSPQCTDPMLLKLRKIVPHYYGVEVVDGNKYIVLENLLSGYLNPNLLDCKIGKITWTRDHNEKKTADQQNKAKVTTTGSLGFRVTGLVVKTRSGKVKESIVKEEGFSSINSENIHEYFNKIVKNDKVQVQKFIDQTEKIIRWFKKQTSKIFFTASLLYVNGKDGRSQTRFIDLAYVYDAEGQHDHNVIQGMESVVEIWKRLL